MYDKMSRAAQFIQDKMKVTPRVGVVLGSGLGPFVDQLSNHLKIPYSDIPYFNETSVEGHMGRLILANANECPIAVLQGRLHAYEGHSLADIVFPIRVLATLGIEALILTNAAGGVNENYHPGQLVLIKDHINLLGQNPLVGPNINELGPRFPDMTDTYSPELRDTFRQSAKKMGIRLEEGVYSAVLGPTFETPAEIRMLRTLGSDMVGMSTVPEAIAARHLGVKIAGVSCITNMAAGVNQQGPLTHDDVKIVAKKAMSSFSELLLTTIGKL